MANVLPPVLTIPGLWSSGPQHWQTHWEAKYPSWQRVEQSNWDHPDRAEWVATLQRAIEAQTEPPILAAHSLGCSLVAQWVTDTGGRGVAGAFLVAPSDVEAPDYPMEGRSFASMPLVPLPFPSMVVASTDDPYVSNERAAAFARAWGSELVTIGPAGHINGASGHGPWPEGEELLGRFCESVVEGRARAATPANETSPRVVRLWSPLAVGLYALLLGYPFGVPLALRDWRALGLQKEVRRHLWGATALSVILISILIFTSHRVGRAFAFVTSISAFSYLKAKLISDIGEFRSANPDTVIEYRRWYTGCGWAAAGAGVVGVLMVVVVFLAVFANLPIPE